MKANWKKVWLPLAFSATLGLTLPAAAQHRPHHKHDRHRREDDHHERASLQALTAYPGTVGEWTTNDNQVYDGFTLKTGSGNLRVKFPTYMGRKIMDAVKPGAAVTVSGLQKLNRQDSLEVRLVNLKVGSRTLYDTPPARPANAENRQEVTVDAKIQDFRRDAKGRINGLYLNDKTILQLPHHSGDQLAGMFKAGDSVQAAGFLKPTAEGEVAAEKLRIVRTRTLTVNGTSYLVR